MLKSKENQGVKNSIPKSPTKLLWLMEFAFIALSVFFVVALVGVLYLSANSNKKSQENQSFANNLVGSSGSNKQDAQLIAKNEPAVVRIAASYCPDFVLRLGSIEQNFSGGCSAGYGSGFIISPDGYVATNGHVVKSSVGEVLLTSIETSNLGIIKNYLSFISKAGVINQATADDYYKKAAAGNSDILKQIADTLSSPILDKTEVKETSQQGYYAVQLANEAVEFDTNDLKKFKYNGNIVKANLIDSDYDPYANVTADGFTTSDVAILKIDGKNNYPYNVLGSINSLSQGNQLTVIGFPGGAENELVSKAESIPTPTSGTVSSIRTANGTKNKLIQTDTSIAKGNSGGPAYNSNGEVIGIATYQVSDGLGTGSKFNYLRDIQDLKDLLSKNGIALATDITGTQKLWNDGLSEFSNARYSSAIDKFNKTKLQYPQHRLANEFIAKAQSAKSQGKESSSGSMFILILIIATVAVLVPTVLLFVIIRIQHRRRDAHEEYMNSQKDQMAKNPQSVITNPSMVNPTHSINQNTNRNIDMLSNAPGPQNNSQKPPQ